MGAVSSASWWRTGRLVQNHGRYTTRRSDITNNFHLERVMDTITENGTGLSVHGHMINYLKFADDVDFSEEDAGMSCKKI